MNLAVMGVLVVVWLVGMGLMRHAKRPAARRVATPQGAVWVECRRLPGAGSRVRAYGHLDSNGRYDPDQAQWGCLEAREGTYHWESSERGRYA